ncbi:hypothetical protein ACIPLR_00170 [Herbaspirillum huttiense]|jgi:hypothetical protein|uniref:Uncharacterized protein n=3 Tax=Herbaspirillum huttiense TaxID=863372 RepID=A0AAJ2LWF1_9BURK|nr:MULTISPECIES: hypothetical protein [Herbaspirillum]MAF04920.1 hypothetical protein [Herbaspirillum sp.]MBN9359779.1 hypothetical protein [Herbaspirillum huttiense]MBO14622.1 hypothetical protein [Herbaspirillum sp.]MBP1316379.1 hypothetical protein [Herbaspirillum sp. 1130]MCO4855325.1 hypothetical protein [Herbaspirillum sp. WGmk3]|tara:strand:- start:1108 stop:1338 length:231 start_codon:yes stop_codon:yes gene_type:complete
MTHFDLASDARFAVASSTPSSLAIRLGRREIFICRDTYVRRYRVNPVIECSAGIEPGHVEILLFRRWLVVLSKARG